MLVKLARKLLSQAFFFLSSNIIFLSDKQILNCFHKTFSYFLIYFIFNLTPENIYKSSNLFH